MAAGLAVRLAARCRYFWPAPGLAAQRLRSDATARQLSRRSGVAGRNCCGRSSNLLCIRPPQWRSTSGNPDLRRALGKPVDPLVVSTRHVRPWTRASQQSTAKRLVSVCAGFCLRALNDFGPGPLLHGLWPYGRITTALVRLPLSWHTPHCRA